MTKNEKLIVSAYTGVLMVDWNEFLDFAEEKLKRPILAKETNTEEFANERIAIIEDDFIKLCEDDEDGENK